MYMHMCSVCAWKVCMHACSFFIHLLICSICQQSTSWKSCELGQIVFVLIFRTFVLLKSVIGSLIIMAFMREGCITRFYLVSAWLRQLRFTKFVTYSPMQREEKISFRIKCRKKICLVSNKLCVFFVIWDLSNIFFNKNKQQLFFFQTNAIYIKLLSSCLKTT